MDEIDMAPVVEVFTEFFTSMYSAQMNELLLHYPKRRSLEVDYYDLERFDIELADRLIESPESTIDAAEQAIGEMNLSVPNKKKFKPHVRFFNIPNQDMLIEEIGSKHLSKMISFKGVVTRRGEVLHKMKVAVFRCGVCDMDFRFNVGKDFKPPKRCESCKKMSLTPVPEKSSFIDVQRAEVQELLERVRGGTPAARIELWLEDDLVNRIVPGDNIQVSGILRLKEPSRQRNKQDLIYGRYLDVNHVSSIQKDFEEIEISDEDVKKILELSASQNIRQKIVRSVAPALYGHEEVKLAIALQLFGGTKNKFMKGRVRIRDDIHILLIGDPGLAKTRFLQSAVQLSPKSIYVSGKSVSSAGLTVAAERDELSEGGWTLKAGALVIASGGLAGVDEFDKISDDDRSSLHEVLESQTVSVAKAGIVARFKAKTAVLAAANPKYGRFDLNRNLAEQFNIPPSLLSRFDLIFPIVDVLDEERDARLAEHILDAHFHALENDGDEIIEEEEVDPILLKKYIAYARRNVHPQLTREATEKIKEYYVDLRSMGKRSGVVTITPRYLEGLVRLAEAHAKMKLSDTVTAEDADTAINLMKYVMSKVMTDKETGLIDVDIVATGRPASQTEKLKKADTVKDIIRRMEMEYESADIEAVVEEAKQYGIEEHFVKKVIDELLSKGELYQSEKGHVKFVD